MSFVFTFDVCFLDAGRINAAHDSGKIHSLATGSHVDISGGDRDSLESFNINL